MDELFKCYYKNCKNQINGNPWTESNLTGFKLSVIKISDAKV